jgi:sulfur relay (sulfurtransferase) DsrF/TusC family protein
MRNNYIVIQGWMITDLNLNGSSLLTFALIYGFSQDGNSEFTGSINYVCKWLNCSRPTAMKALKELCEMDLIVKSELVVNGVTFNRYKISLERVKKLYTGSKETLQGGSKETLPNNTTLYNTNNNIDILIPKSELELTFDSYLEMRKQIKKPATPHAVNLIKKKLVQMTHNNESEMCDLLNQSIVNSWADIYPIKNTFVKKEKPTMRTTNEVFDNVIERIRNGEDTTVKIIGL